MLPKFLRRWGGIGNIGEMEFLLCKMGKPNKFIDEILSEMYNKTDENSHGIKEDNGYE